MPSKVAVIGVGIWGPAFGCFVFLGLSIWCFADGLAVVGSAILGTNVAPRKNADDFPLERMLIGLS